MKILPYFLMVLYTFPLETYSQQELRLNDLFEAHQKGEPIFGEVNRFIQSADCTRVLDICKTYIMSQEDKDRYLSHRIFYKLCEAGQDQKCCTEAAYQLINNGLRDPLATNVSMVINYLEHLPGEVFDSRAQNSLASIIAGNPMHYKQLVMLSGRLQMHQ